MPPIPATAGTCCGGRLAKAPWGAPGTILSEGPRVDALPAFIVRPRASNEEGLPVISNADVLTVLRHGCFRPEKATIQGVSIRGEAAQTQWLGDRKRQDGMGDIDLLIDRPSITNPSWTPWPIMILHGDHVYSSGYALGAT